MIIPIISLSDNKFLEARAAKQLGKLCHPLASVRCYSLHLGQNSACVSSELVHSGGRRELQEESSGLRGPLTPGCRSPSAS